MIIETPGSTTKSGTFNAHLRLWLDEFCEMAWKRCAPSLLSHIQEVLQQPNLLLENGPFCMTVPLWFRPPLECKAHHTVIAVDEAPLIFQTPPVCWFSIPSHGNIHVFFIISIHINYKFHISDGQIPRFFMAESSPDPPAIVAFLAVWRPIWSSESHCSCPAGTTRATENLRSFPPQMVERFWMFHTYTAIYTDIYCISSIHQLHITRQKKGSSPAARPLRSVDRVASKPPHPWDMEDTKQGRCHGNPWESIGFRSSGDARLSEGILAGQLSW